MYEVNEGKSKICLYVRTLPYPFASRKRYLSRIHPDVRKSGQSRGHFQLQVSNWQAREPHIGTEMYAYGDNRGDSDRRSSDDRNVQLEPSAQLDRETTQAPST